MYNYYEEVNLLDYYVKEHFKSKIYQTKNKDELRVAQSKHWGASEAVLKCGENFLRDPADILEDLTNEFQSISLWDCKQKINKDHYLNAAEAVTELRDYLLKERRK